MVGIRWVFGAAAVAAAWFAPATGARAACTATIQAASDTPIAAGPTFNVGQQATFTVTGFTPAAYAWSVSGPANIKDYNDDLGTRGATPQTPPQQPPLASPLPWSTVALTAADMTQPSLTFYWMPSAAQIHPLNAPETRTVTLNYSDGTSSCTATLAVTVERNMTDVTRQPEDFYTSTHRASTTTNAGQGNVIDEHMYWHVEAVGSLGATGDWTRFLAWHGYFLRRFDEWRQTFGYPPVAPWYPGRRLPAGPEFDHPGLRQAFDPDFNRIPWQFTLAGTPVSQGGSAPPASSPSLADFPDLDAFSDDFEGSYHGAVHCNIGVFFGFGSMCDFSSPKDPMFWRWHGFIDLLYRNYCALKQLTCHSPAGPGADPWIGDNAADITANGVPPSPGIHYLSPDIWNRRTENLDPLCLPGTIPTSLNTVGGVTRNCGSEADHENPDAGHENYLYATLRNIGTAPQRNVYAEVAVYIANASTGLSWPTDFQLLENSRQFITINLEPGQVTAIGPLPWDPPTPTPSDHWCIYIRVLSVQEAPPVEGAVVDANVANSNSIAWRNLKIVNFGERMSSRFIVRNIRRQGEALALEINAAPALVENGRIVLQLDRTLQRALGEIQLPDGVRSLGEGRYMVTGMRTIIDGLRLPPRGEGVAEIRLETEPGSTATGDITVTQRSSAGVDGGTTLRVADRRRRPRSYRR